MATFEDDLVPQDGDDGSTLRRKLEAALKREKRAVGIARSDRAVSVIANKKLTLVKPEDLDGVELDQVETKALELQEQRQQAEANTLRSVLQRNGLEGEALEAQVNALLGGQAPEAVARPDETAWSNARQVGQITGMPVPTDHSTKSPRELIEIGLTTPVKR